MGYRLTALALGLLLTGVVVGAASRPAERWEYAVVYRTSTSVWGYRDGNIEVDGQNVEGLADRLGVTIEKQLLGWVEIMNAKGAEGWEVISIEYDQNSTPKMISLKRRI
jgi:hypothetical protein